MTSPIPPWLHLAIVALAVVTVPVSLAVPSAVFQKDFAISPLDVARAIMGIA